jgi:hypothetical protein
MLASSLLLCALQPSHQLHLPQHHTMSLLLLDMLPMELLQLIGNMLNDDHRPSVTSFSLVNRQCRRAVGQVLFRRVRIDVKSPEGLATEVERWSTILVVNDGFRHVRKVDILGDMYEDWKKRHRRAESPEHDGSQCADFQYEDSWLPLSSFIDRMPALKDLYYRCGTEFPCCLLAVLTKDTISPCRLHLTNFGLKSLRRRGSEDITGPLALSRDDLALVTSANLYAIKLYGCGFSAGVADYNFDAIAELVARACPAVKEVQVRQRRSLTSPGARRRKSYPGLKLDQEASPVIRDLGAKAELTELSLGSRPTLTLAAWQSHTNFEVLRTLRINGDVDAAGLVWAARFARFPSLSKFEVESNAGTVSSVTAIVESLPSLQDLTVHGEVSEAMITAIIFYHGETLMRLALPNLSCQADQIADFLEDCPYLEHLSITVKRTQGYFKEVSLYRELGAYPQLRSICLNLDCSVTSRLAPTDPTALQDYKQEQIRQSLVNCAIDKTLAAEIFYVIAMPRSPGVPPRVPHIRKVEMSIINAGLAIAPGAVLASLLQEGHVYRHFERRWMCTMDPRDDRSGKVLAEENKASRDARKLYEDGLGEEVLELGGLEAVFRAMWPEGANGDWRDDWKSFPLDAS